MKVLKTLALAAIAILAVACERVDSTSTQPAEVVNYFPFLQKQDKWTYEVDTIINTDGTPTHQKYEVTFTMGDITTQSLGWRTWLVYNGTMSREGYEDMQLPLYRLETTPDTALYLGYGITELPMVVTKDFYVGKEWELTYWRGVAFQEETVARKIASITDEANGHYNCIRIDETKTIKTDTADIVYLSSYWLDRDIGFVLVHKNATPNEDNATVWRLIK